MKGKKKQYAVRLLALFALCFLIPWHPSALAADDISIRYILQGMEDIKPVNQTHYLVVQSPDSHLWGAFDTSGRQLIDFRFENLAYGGYGCFITSNSTDPLDNWRALVSRDGSFVSEARYGLFKFYNYKWAAGWVVSAAKKTDYDYTPDKKKYYYIDRCDLFYLGDTPRLAGSLSREEFVQAAVHGDYLSVEDRTGNITVYDRDFQPAELQVSSVSDAVYGLRNYTLIDRVTGEALMDGLTGVKEINNGRGLIFQVTQTGFNGAKKTGICTADGEWLMPLSGYGVKTVSRDYAVVTQNKLQGLYSFDRGRLILPCEYSSISTSSQTVDPYVFNGCACGVKDGMKCFVNIETGETVISVPDKSKSISIAGATVYRQTSKNHYEVISPSGKTWRFQDKKMGTTRGDGRLLVIRDVIYNLKGVYNMNGKVVLDIKYRTAPLITDDGYVILRTQREGVHLLEITW